MRIYGETVTMCLTSRLYYSLPTRHGVILDMSIYRVEFLLFPRWWDETEDNVDWQHMDIQVKVQCEPKLESTDTINSAEPGHCSVLVFRFGNGESWRHLSIPNKNKTFCHSLNTRSAITPTKLIMQFHLLLKLKVLGALPPLLHMPLRPCTGTILLMTYTKLDIC